MVRNISSLVGVSKRTEMLLMATVALVMHACDGSLFRLGTSLDQVWSVPMDVTKFPPTAQHVVKTILSGVVLVRTFTLHVYIAFLIGLMWPAMFGTRAPLMVPWLVVAAVKNLGTSLVSLLAGTYTCAVYGAIRPACFRFLCYQILDMVPSFYMWFVGLSLYRDLKKPKEIDKQAIKKEDDLNLDLAIRRRKVKSLADENILREQFEARRKYMGTSAVVVEEIYKQTNWESELKVGARSLDSLLDAMTAEAEVCEPEEFEPIDDGLSLQEKTAKLLGLTMSEISFMKHNMQTKQDFPHYPVSPQKKCLYLPHVMKPNESPLKLLTETSLYSPPTTKPVRPTKSELKSPKDFPNLKTPSEFIESIPEYEICQSTYSDNSENVSGKIMDAYFVSVDNKGFKNPNFDLKKFKNRFGTNVFWNEEKDYGYQTYLKRKLWFDNSNNGFKKLASTGTNVDTNINRIEIATSMSKYKNASKLEVEEHENKVTVIPDVPKRKFNEIGCQASTLSKKVLKAYARNINNQTTSVLPITEKKTSKTIFIKPPIEFENNSPPKIELINKTPRGSKDNTYLGLHLYKKDLERIAENVFAIDKFGAVSSRPFVEDGYSRTYRKYDAHSDQDGQVERER